MGSTFVQDIGYQTIDQDEVIVSPDGRPNDIVTQTSPSWVLTFVRWDIQDPLRTHAGSNDLRVRDSIIVENDCISVTVSTNKGSLTPTMNATLMITDINYETALHPGDFCIVNMVNWTSESRRIVNNSRANMPINGAYDGFKGIFKVQGVRKSLGVDPATGTKRWFVKVDGFAFTEFNNTIYFNPNLINQKGLQNQAIFTADVGAAWINLVAQGNKPPIQDVISFLILNLIGPGVNPKASHTVNGLVVSPNTHYLVPNQVGQLLGIRDTKDLNSRKSAIAAKDIYQYMFGIQQYLPSDVAQVEAGFNPSNLEKNGAVEHFPNFFYTDSYCKGHSLLKPDYWNQVKLWSIMNQYTNTPLNELYTTFKINPYGQVMPMVIFRQIPFTSEDFGAQKLGLPNLPSSSIKVTKFLSLPRWKIDPSKVFSIDIGRDETARINFVQYYAKSNYTKNGVEISQETGSGNYVFDKDDILRSGLKPLIVQNQFDDLTDALVKAAPVWARILGDAVIGGQLKMNGTIECIGIVEPIAVGENLEFDGVAYHIEQVMHTASINSEGIKQFRTTLALSHGISINSSAEGQEYAEMTDSNAYQKRIDDYAGSNILPGVSESQDTANRKGQIDLITIPNLPFRQPSTSSKKKTGE